MAAQKPGIQTNAMKAETEKSSNDSKYTLCKQAEVDNILSLCTKIIKLIINNNITKSPKWFTGTLLDHYDVPIVKKLVGIYSWKTTWKWAD